MGTSQVMAGRKRCVPSAPSQEEAHGGFPASPTSPQPPPFHTPPAPLLSLVPREMSHSSELPRVLTVPICSGADTAITGDSWPAISTPFPAKLPVQASLPGDSHRLGNPRLVSPRAVWSLSGPLCIPTGPAPDTKAIKMLANSSFKLFSY